MLKRVRKGFTLLELIVVLVVLAVLTAIAIPTYNAVINSAQKSGTAESAKALGRDIMATAALGRPTTTAPNGSTDDVATAAGEVQGVTVTVSTTYTSDGCVKVVGSKTVYITIPSDFGGVVSEPLETGTCKTLDDATPFVSP